MFSEFPVDFWLALILAAVAGWVARQLWHGTKRSKSKGRAEPFSPQYFAGLNHLLNEQQDKAIEVLRGLAEADADAVETQLALGLLYRRRGEVDRAIHIHESIMERSDLSPQLQQQAKYALGEDYLNAGLLDRAESYFQQLIAYPVHRSSSLRHLLSIYEQQGDWLQAIHVFQQLATFSSPEHPTAIAHYYCELAEQSVREKQPTQAVNYIASSFAAQRNFPRGNLLNADLKLAAGDAKTAAVLCRKVMELHPHLLPIALPRFIKALRVMSLSMDQATGELSFAGADTAQRAALAYAAIVAQIVDEPYLLQCLPDFLRHDAMLGEMVQSLVSNSAMMEPNQLQAVATALGTIFRRTHRYRCLSCGVNTHSHFWQCPGCHGWDTLAPVSRLELSPIGRRY